MLRRWLLRGTLALLLIATAGFVAAEIHVWRLGEEVFEHAEREGRLGPVSETPLSVFEETVAFGTLSRTWNRSGFPCRQLRPGLEGGVDVSLANLLSLDFRADRTLRSHIRRASIACILDAHYNDTTLLRLWLTQSYFGRGKDGRSLYGAEAASREHFGKPTTELNASEAAMIAALTIGPSLASRPEDWRETAEWIARRAAEYRAAPVPSNH